MNLLITFLPLYAILLKTRCKAVDCISIATNMQKILSSKCKSRYLGAEGREDCVYTSLENYKAQISWTTRPRFHGTDLRPYAQQPSATVLQGQNTFTRRSYPERLTVSTETFSLRQVG